MQGEQCMGLPLASYNAAARRLATSMSLKARPEESQNAQTGISRTGFQKSIITQHGTYSLNVVVTERSSRSRDGAMMRHGSGMAALPAHAEQPTVLLLHGFLGCAGDWDDISAALALTCRCVSVDLPGHGATVVHATGVCSCLLFICSIRRTGTACSQLSQSPMFGGSTLLPRHKRVCCMRFI